MIARTWNPEKLRRGYSLVHLANMSFGMLTPRPWRTGGFKSRIPSDLGRWRCKTSVRRTALGDENVSDSAGGTMKTKFEFVNSAWIALTDYRNLFSRNFLGMTHPRSDVEMGFFEGRTALNDPGMTFREAAPAIVTMLSTGPSHCAIEV